MDRSVLLAHIRKTRLTPGDRGRAERDARIVSAYLAKTYGAEVWGVGSLFEDIRPFRSRSDIDLVVKGVPAEKYLGAYSHASDLTDFKLDLIPYETANELILEIVRTKGVPL